MLCSGVFVLCSGVIVMCSGVIVLCSGILAVHWCCVAVVVYSGAIRDTVLCLFCAVLLLSLRVWS